jgi:hypothetical protein
MIATFENKKSLADHLPIAFDPRSAVIPEMLKDGIWGLAGSVAF